MKALISTLIILALAAPAFAVLDPDPDQIGFYFDVDADVNRTEASGSVPFFVYLVLTNPTAPDVQGFEFGYRLGYPDGMGSLIFRLATNIDPGCLFCGEDGLGILEGEGLVPILSPLPTAPATVLLDWQYMILVDFPVEWYIQPTTFSVDGQPLYYTDAGPVPMYPVSGSFDAPVANVNGDPVVATEASTFGSLKALYR